MRHAIVLFSTLLVGFSATTASALPAFYMEVVNDMDAGAACASSTFDTVPGCAGLCHVGDPNGAGASTLPTAGANDREPFLSVLTTKFGLQINDNNAATDFDAPVRAFVADTAYAAALADIQANCGSPETTLADDLNSVSPVGSTGGGPVYGCDVASVDGRAAGASGVGVGGLLIAAALLGRRRRR